MEYSTMLIGFGGLLILGMIFSFLYDKIAIARTFMFCVVTFMLTLSLYMKTVEESNISIGIQEYYLMEDGERSVRYVPLVQDVIDQKILNLKRQKLELMERNTGALRKEVETEELHNALSDVLEKYQSERFRRDQLDDGIQTEKFKFRDNVVPEIGDGGA